MKETMLARIFDAIESYEDQKFGEWIVQWPGQIVCNSRSIYFSQLEMQWRYNLILSLFVGAYNLPHIFH